MSTNYDSIIAEINQHARERRYAIKLQQKLDRALESRVRESFTGWTPDLPESDRDKFNDEVRALVAAARDRTGDPKIFILVAMTDEARAPFDKYRKDHEGSLLELVSKLPPAITDWIESIPGVGLPSLAAILAETGDLRNYRGPYKLNKRLGYAPYDGFAGSTWKRRSWRPRELSADEWIANPFKPTRYAAMTQIAQAIFYKQWKSGKKTESGEGEPNGDYGQIYFDERCKAMAAHPEWTKGHLHRHGLRLMMKEFLKRLWCTWRDAFKALNQSRPVPV